MYVKIVFNFGWQLSITLPDVMILTETLCLQGHEAGEWGREQEEDNGQVELSGPRVQ